MPGKPPGSAPCHQPPGNASHGHRGTGFPPARVPGAEGQSGQEAEGDVEWGRGRDPCLATAQMAARSLRGPHVRSWRKENAGPRGNLGTDTNSTAARDRRSGDDPDRRPQVRGANTAWGGALAGAGANTMWGAGTTGRAQQPQE